MLKSISPNGVRRIKTILLCLFCIVLTLILLLPRKEAVSVKYTGLAWGENHSNPVTITLDGICYRHLIGSRDYFEGKIDVSGHTWRSVQHPDTEITDPILRIEKSNGFFGLHDVYLIDTRNILPGLFREQAQQNHLVFFINDDFRSIYAFSSTWENHPHQPYYEIVAPANSIVEATQIRDKYYSFH